MIKLFRWYTVGGKVPNCVLSPDSRLTLDIDYPYWVANSHTWNMEVVLLRIKYIRALFPHYEDVNSGVATVREEWAATGETGPERAPAY